MTIYGATPYGSGTPSVAQDGGGVALKDGDNNGTQQGSRLIDPRTRDYVIDSVTGRPKGMSNAEQLVYLAVNTTKASSAMRSLGQEIFKIERITSNFIRRVDDTLRASVQHIVDLKLIEIIGTRVDIVRPGVARALLQWRDLSTGDDASTPVPLPVPGV